MSNHHATHNERIASACLPDAQMAVTAKCRPRVLLCGPARSAVSGVATHLNQILRSTLRNECELLHFQLGSEGRREAPAAKLVRLAWSPIALAAALIRTRADIVHLNTSFDPKAFWRDLFYLLVAKTLRRKVVYQVHGGVIDGPFSRRRSLGLIVGWVLRMADAVVVLSPGEKAECERLAPIKHLKVIPNAVDLAEFGNAVSKSYEKSNYCLVYIGRLERDKGLFEAIDAMQLLRTERPSLDVRLDIAGSGSAERDLARRIESLALGDKVRMTGPLFGDAKARSWKQADIFVFPSFHAEGIPYSVLESLASGTPMITTRAGGIAETVEDGKHGIFIAPRDPRALADAITALLDDKHRLHDMSAACLEHARRYYSIERLVSQFEQLYRNVAIGDGTAPA